MLPLSDEVGEGRDDAHGVVAAAEGERAIVAQVAIDEVHPDRCERSCAAPRIGRHGRTGIHDHAQLWTAYGVLDGHETVERYERLDDGTREGYAEVRETARLSVGPGTVDLVPPWQIHAEESGAERTVAIIVRSGKPGAFLQNRFDPAMKTTWQGYGPTQIPYALS